MWLKKRGVLSVRLLAPLDDDGWEKSSIATYCKKGGLGLDRWPRCSPEVVLTLWTSCAKEQFAVLTTSV